MLCRTDSSDHLFGFREIVVHWFLTRSASLKIAKVEHTTELTARSRTDIDNVTDVARLHVLTFHNALQFVALVGLDHRLFGFTPTLFLKAF